MPDTPPSGSELQQDPLLRDAPTISGFKVLEPAVLYAKVGQGGMGAVYRGRHFKLDLDVAVKCLKPSLADDSPEFVARFEREARLAASLAHQNVVRVMDVHQKHGLHYIVMEFVRGESARERVLRKGKLGEQESLAILLGAASGLAEAHARGIVHRDIKPDNVMVSTEGRVKLADLGLAKALANEEQSVTVASGVMGTPQYMAPEQWETPAVGPSADIWALGATLYYLLCAEHAIESAPLAAIARRVQDRDFPCLRDACPGLRDEVYALLERCVGRDPATRFADARELVEALRPLVEIGEQALADTDSVGTDAEAVVSPPPRQTLMKIRASIESGATPDPEAPTIPSPGQTMRVPPPEARNAESQTAPITQQVKRSPWRRWAGVLLAIVAIVGVRGWYAGWFDSSVSMDETADLFAARLIYRDAMELLPQPGKLDEAIAKLQQALRTSSKLQEAREPLALALQKKASRLQQDDLDGAFAAIREATYRLPNDERVQPLFDELQGRIRMRLVAGVTLTSPAGCDVQNSEVICCSRETFELSGRIDSPGFRRLGFIIVDRKASRGTPTGVHRKVTVVDGEFAESFTMPPGDTELRFLILGESGVEAGMVRTARISGRVGDLDDAVAAVGVGRCPNYEIFNEAGCRMLPISVRPFRMGSVAILGRDADEKLHQVTMQNPFWLAESEVTRAQWQRVMMSTPWPKDLTGFTGDLPATHVSSAQAIEFCKRLTALERAAKRLPANYHYVLPTEAQWEFACLSGEQGIFGQGIDYANLGEYAVYQGSRDASRPHRVKSRKANAFGLFDMNGNVGEWCMDLARRGPGDLLMTTTYQGDRFEPVSLIGSQRVHRGGSFASTHSKLRAADRSAADLDAASPQIGFRPALVRRPQ